MYNNKMYSNVRSIHENELLVQFKGKTYLDIRDGVNVILYYGDVYSPMKAENTQYYENNIRK